MIAVACWNKQMKLSLGVARAAMSFLSILLAGVAWGEQGPENRSRVQVFASADESSPMIELVPAASPLSPIGEMTGAGGVKWFMVKTRNGNVGWIKADNNADVKKIDRFFRSLPREAVVIRPVDNAPASARPMDEIAPSVSSSSASSAPAKAAVTIPVRIEGTKALVPVTLTSGSSSVTAVLVVDTGASQTLISKRLAMELRLRSIDTQTSQAVGALFAADTGQVDSVKVGAAEVKNVRVSIHDRSSDSGSEGLLGFDFLGQFRMSIDTEKKVMLLAPREQ